MISIKSKTRKSVLKLFIYHPNKTGERSDFKWLRHWTTTLSIETSERIRCRTRIRKTRRTSEAVLIELHRTHILKCKLEICHRRNWIELSVLAVFFCEFWVSEWFFFENAKKAESYVYSWSPNKIWQGCRSILSSQYDMTLCIIMDCQGENLVPCKCVGLKNDCRNKYRETRSAFWSITSQVHTNNYGPISLRFWRRLLKAVVDVQFWQEVATLTDGCLTVNPGLRLLLSARMCKN